MKGIDKGAIENKFQGNYKNFYDKFLPNSKKIKGNEFSCLCIFHEDKNPSLNFNSQTGKFFCHGCNAKGDIFGFYAALKNLNSRTDFSKILAGIASEFGIPTNGDGQRRIVATYDYDDEGGGLLYQVCRLEPKSFIQRQVGFDGYDYNLKGVRRVIYNLPRVLENQEIIIVEGEKDADAVSALPGFTGTTSPMGAGKWRSEYNEFFKDKDVVLIPDNDGEGRKHMAQVGAVLKGIAKSIKLLDLPGSPGERRFLGLAGKVHGSSGSRGTPIAIGRGGAFIRSREESG